MREKLSKILPQAALITECESQKLRLDTSSAEYHSTDADDGSSKGYENAEDGQ